MNKRKQLVIALVVLGVLIVAALLVRRDPFEKGRNVDYLDLIAYRPAESIDRIAVTNKEGSVTAEKRSDGWWIIEPRQLPADDNQLKNAAALLEIIVVVDTASKKPERQAEYGLAKDSAERIEVKAFAAGNEVLNFAAGKHTPDGQGTFIVLTKDPNTVYVISKPLPPILNSGIMEWRSRVALDLPRETIERIQVVNNKGVLDLEKESGDTWRKKNDPDWQADNVRFGQVIGAFNRLTWVEVLDQPDPTVDYGFKTPQAKVTATAGGKDNVVIFGKDVEGSTGNCWLKVENDPKVYQVRKAILDRFTRDFDYYKGEPPKPDLQELKEEN
jgi:hypothetical protein